MRKVLWISLAGVSSLVSVVFARGVSGEEWIGSALIYFTTIALIGLVYVAPGFLALHRRHPNSTAIVALNVLAGWTLLGWIGSFVWASTATGTPPLQTTGNAVVRVVGVLVGVLGLFAVGAGFSNLGSSQGLLHSAGRALGVYATPYLPGWIPIIVGMVCLAGATYMLNRCRFFSE